MSKPTKVRNKSRGTERDASHRLGFMKDDFSALDDFDQIGKHEIAHLFNAATIATRGYQIGGARPIDPAQGSKGVTH